MRLLIGTILVLIAGGILAAAFLVHPVTLSPAEKIDLKSSCIVCHNGIPAYIDTAAVHNAHSTTECRACHSENVELTAADNAHDILRWASIILVGLGLAGLILNFAVVRIRIRNRNSLRK